MAIPVLELLKMAEEMFEEGYARSEAYPIVRCKKNGWPTDMGAEAYVLMDAYLKMRHLSVAYELKHGKK